MIPTTSLITLTSLAQRHSITFSWICDGNALLLDGPSNITVVSYNSESVGPNQQQLQLMDVMKDYKPFHEAENSGLVLIIFALFMLNFQYTCNVDNKINKGNDEGSSPNTKELSLLPPPTLTSRNNILPVNLPPLPQIDNFILQVATSRKSNAKECDTLSPSVFLKQFYPNSRQAIPFENEFFIGKILFVVRTKPLDPYYKHFFEHSKDRMYIVQLQGVFKTPPRNASSLFMGECQQYPCLFIVAQCDHCQVLKPWVPLQWE